MNKHLLRAQLTTIGFALLTSPGSATIYLWHDATGTAHYTNKGYEIPPRYSSRFKVLYPDTAEKPAGQSINTKEHVIPELPQNLPEPVLATQPNSDKDISLPHRKVKKT